MNLDSLRRLSTEINAHKVWDFHIRKVIESNTGEKHLLEFKMESDGCKTIAVYELPRENCILSYTKDMGNDINEWKESITDALYKMVELEPFTRDIVDEIEDILMLLYPNNYREIMTTKDGRYVVDWSHSNKIDIIDGLTEKVIASRPLVTDDEQMVMEILDDLNSKLSVSISLSSLTPITLGSDARMYMWQEEDLPNKKDLGNVPDTHEELLDADYFDWINNKEDD